MRYIEFKDNLKDFTVFSLSDIRKADSHFHRRRLNEWQEKGYIKKVLRGWYIFSDLKIDESALFEIANRIYGPSYVSFESALSYYGLIPESVYGVTSASTRRTMNLKTPVAEFSYRTLKPKLFFGYDIIKYKDKNFKMAFPEKAVLDHLYINTSLKSREDFLEMRVNKGAFLKALDKKRMASFSKRFDEKALKNRAASFMEFIEHA